MILTKECFPKEITSPVRNIDARVEVYEGSTLVNLYCCSDVLKSFTVERVGEESKFFGFGICQKLNVKLLDPNRQINISTKNTIEIEFGVGCEYLYPYPCFYVSEVHRDENTNELSITAYDKLYRASNHTVSELELPSAYTVEDVLIACAVLLELPYNIKNVNDLSFDTVYPTGANFEGTETIREALNAIAEATQTIYYIDNNWELVFKRLDIDGEPDFTIDKANYFSLDSKTNRRLTSVCHATELGDNVEGGLKISATGEAVRLDNVTPEEHNMEVKVASKNLIYSPYYNVSGTIQGVTYTVNSDGSITANGTATKDSFFYLVQTYRIPAGTYTLSSVNLSSNRELRGAIYNTDNTLDRYIYGGTFTIDKEKLIYIYLVILNGNTVSNVTFKPILELGTTATNYTPYVSDVTDVTVTKCGRNLITYPYAETSKVYNEITFVDNADGSITASGTTTSGAFFQFKNNSSQFFLPKGKYFFKALNKTGSFTTFYAYVALLKDSGNENYFDIGKGVSFELEETTQLSINCVVEKSHDGSEVIFKPQLEVGEAASDYEVSLQATTYTPEADGTVIGVNAVSPVTTLYTDSEGILISAEGYAKSNLSGTTQYVRNNPFWDMRDDIADLVDNALAAVYQTTINQFDCSWRGNFALEIGDKIELITKDDSNVISYVLNDSISYNGFLSEQTSWIFTDNDGETASNPTTLGESLKQTFAKVDKVNKQIDLVVSDVSANSEAISQIKMDTSSISATVKATTNSLNDEIDSLNNRVDAVMTAEDVTIAIQNELENGVDKVTTTTGFTFNEEGLTITKTGSEISTQITEDGMTVRKDNDDVLVADNKGVTAIDLHATTYLIIGANSRIEDYGSGRTGCFWIG